MMNLDEVLNNERKNSIILNLENVDEFYMYATDGFLQEIIYNQLMILKEEDEEIAYFLLHAENADRMFGLALPDDNINLYDDEVLVVAKYFYIIVRSVILRFNEENFIEDLEDE